MTFVLAAGLRLWNDICSFSRTKVMECHFVHSAGLSFIKPCKRVYICKTITLDKNVRARGQFY